MSVSLSATPIHGPGVWKLWWLSNDASNCTPTCVGVFTTNEDAHLFKRACVDSGHYNDSQFLITRGYVTRIRFEEEVPKS